MITMARMPAMPGVIMFGLIMVCAGALSMVIVVVV